MEKKTKVIAGAAGAVCGLTLLSGASLFHFALAKNGGGKYLRRHTVKKTFGDEKEGVITQIHNDYVMAVRENNAEFTRQHAEEEVFISADDGTILAGYCYEQLKKSHKWVICFHGYRAEHQEIMTCGFTTHFYDMGFNVLSPDMRASGKSGGRYIGMGWLERKDVLKWIQFVQRRDSEAEIVLFGESMGAAAVLAASGEELPAAVKTVIADSGYASVWDQLHQTMKGFHLPSFPALYMASLYSRRYAGYGFRKANIARQVSRSSVPVLLFHGTKDNLVSVSNLQVLYDAKTEGKKEMHAVENAGHVCSSFVLKEEYWNIIRRFNESCGI